MTTVLIILLVLLLMGALPPVAYAAYAGLEGGRPSWPHSREWGYYPSGGLGLLLVVLIILWLLGIIH